MGPFGTRLSVHRNVWQNICQCKDLLPRKVPWEAHVLKSNSKEHGLHQQDGRHEGTVGRSTHANGSSPASGPWICQRDHQNYYKFDGSNDEDNVGAAETNFSIDEKFGKVQVGNNAGNQQLTKVEKCPICKKKAYKGGALKCWDDPKNADKHPKWYVEMLKRKATKKKDSWSQMELSTVVSKKDLRWLWDAPKMNKIDSEIEITGLHWPSQLKTWNR